MHPFPMANRAGGDKGCLGVHILEFCFYRGLLLADIEGGREWLVGALVEIGILHCLNE